MKFTKVFLFILLTTLAFSSCKTKNGEVATSKETTDNKVKTNSHKTANLNWLTMDEVESALKKDPRPVLVDVYTKWCGPCKMLDRKTFSDPKVQKIFAEKFHIVKFDAEGADDIVFNGKTYGNPRHQAGKRGRNSAHELASFFRVRGYPTMAIMNGDLKIIDKIVGYKSADQLINALQKHIK